ncbi:glucokinase [Sphaerotilus hippei]|uniref:Glucokinase n=1 Tax=Sphaerotilus hippei TaxID=744406 RepID=A0A318H3L9_9BURK|nr:glucokinase [Sphaerotilus hippei]PXW98146.1 glucokinase [Sphaerotilus hippei]
MTNGIHGSPYPHLVADIGGTNARFGWIEHAGAEIADVMALPTSGHPTLADAARDYLARTGHHGAASMAMGIANPVTGDEVRMTNHHWAFSISALQAELGLQRLVVINDFTALALSLPSLQAGQLRQVGGGSARANAPIALLGPGTGLGVSGLLPSAGRWVPLSGEGGHVTLSAVNAREAALIDQLRRRYGHASAERALSGAGLVALYDAVCALNGRAPDPMRPADVSDRGLNGSDPACVEALEHFCALLGSVAGNLALTLGAHGGVYIGGGIVPRLGAFFDQSLFRKRFEAKGRFQDYLAAMPVLVINAEVSPALMGAARALEQA